MNERDNRKREERREKRVKSNGEREESFRES